MKYQWALVLLGCMATTWHSIGAMQQTLTREQAITILSADQRFTKGIPQFSMGIDQASFAKGVEKGLWSARQFDFVLTPAGGRYFASVQRNPFGGGYVRFKNVPTRQKLVITGIRTGDREARVEFSYNFASPATVAVDLQGVAGFELYDDGWRVSVLRLQEVDQTFTLTLDDVVADVRTTPSGSRAERPGEAASFTPTTRPPAVVAGDTALAAQLARHPSAFGKYTVRHAHAGASLLSSGEFSSCMGILFVLSDHIEYAPVAATDGQQHPLSIQYSEIRETALNRLPIGELAAFHVTLTDKRNYNFATRDDRNSILTTIGKALEAPKSPTSGRP